MRVVDPKSFKSRNINKSTEKRKSRIIPILLLITVFIIIAMLYLFYKNKVLSDKEIVNEVNQAKDIEAPIETKTGVRMFSGNEFRLLYDNYLLTNTEKVGSPPYITGNDIADARIRQLAEARGYKLRTSPSTSPTSVDGVPLQDIAQMPWKELQLAANQAGLIMTLTSGYRSVDDQRELFLNRLNAESISLSSISSGSSDEAIIKILTKAAVPGYSKHHSGYTIDIKCDGWDFENFKNSSCNDWLVADNYKKAKEFGFIPSYPMGADLQGPDPEAWEYVYIGTEVLNY